MCTKVLGTEMYINIPDPTNHVCVLMFGNECPANITWTYLIKKVLEIYIWYIKKHYVGKNKNKTT